MSGCPSLSNPHKVNTNVAYEDHPKNNLFNFDTPNKYHFSLPKSNNSSIRRTFSADMSTQKWLENNEFTMKRSHSSEQLQALGEEDYDHVNTIEQELDDGDHIDNKGISSGGAAFEDIWSSILFQKKLDESECGSGQVPPPYVHPLVKRSASSLSEKSLKICTESLGSETGSDGFSYPPSEEEQQQEETCKKCHVEEMKVFKEVAKYNYPVNKKIRPQNPFPPPLPSLAHRNDGSNVQMRTQREDGRLVLEAVSIPSQNCFRSQRQDGRLLLIVTPDQHLQQEVEDNGDEEVEYEDEIDEEEDVMEEEENKSRLGTNGVSNVQRSSTAMIMSKLIELTRTRNNSTWPRNFNKTVIKTLDEAEEVEAQPPTARSLPPRPKMSTTTAAEATLNAYEYYWRSPTAAAVAVLKPLAGKQNANRCAASPQVVKDDNNNNNNNNNSKLLLARNGKGGAQEVVLVKAAGVGGAAGEKREYLIPLLRGCKEPRRSLLFWEPYCIATS